jgi:phospholipid transport system substrate-binding protein
VCKNELHKEQTLKKFWCAVIILLSINQCLKAAGKEPNDPNAIVQAEWEAAIKDPNNPNELLKVKSDAVLKVLQTKELDQKEKTRILDIIIGPFFDFELMSKLSLGRANWTKLTDSQQKKFTELFTRRLKDAYLGQITRYRDEKLLLKPAEPQKNGVSITMDVLSGDKKITTVYKVRHLSTQWMVYDVEIEGVSILMTYKAQFDDIINRGGVAELFSHLEKQQVK